LIVPSAISSNPSKKCLCGITQNQRAQATSTANHAIVVGRLVAAKSKRVIEASFFSVTTGRWEIENWFPAILLNQWFVTAKNVGCCISRGALASSYPREMISKSHDHRVYMVPTSSVAIIIGIRLE